MTEHVRAQFPSLRKTHNGQPVIYLDGPAGTQVPTMVLEQMETYYNTANANTHGYFSSSKTTDALVAEVRSKVATFLGAESPGCISFGANMTSLTYSLSRGLGRLFAPGDEILVSQLDHEANRGPWYALEEHGIVVHEIPLLQNGQLDYRAIPKLISDRTRLVAVGISSNILGTVNDIAQIREMMPSDIHLLLDAVHYAPHYAIDVQELNCDFLLCSAYKFYGPHVGLLYCRPGLLDTIPVDRLRVQEQVGPHRIETGTLNHAALAGVGAAIDFIAHHGDGSNLRSKLSDAMQTIGLHENTLIQRLSRGINSIPGLSLHGPGFESAQRAPTLAMSSVRHTPQYICEKLASEGIHAWDGHFYAIRAAEILGLLDKGGVTRMGIAMYNSAEEIDRTIEVLEHIQQGNA